MFFINLLTETFYGFSAKALPTCWIYKPGFYFFSQTKCRSKAFLEWKSIDLSHELWLTCWGNVNYYKSVHQPIPTHENREHPGSFQNKSVSSAFNWVPPFYILKRNRNFSASKEVFLQSTSQFSFKFCINLQCH